MLVPSETSWAISNVKCQATALVKNHMIPPVNWTLSNKILFSQVWWHLPLIPALRRQEQLVSVTLRPAWSTKRVLWFTS